nr:hypothetical protein [Tanacetum cinerariifolium]
MHTRSSSNLPGESSPNPTSSNPKRRNRRRFKQPFILEESPVDTMVDQRTMAELLRAPTEGYADEIMVPPILADQFELKQSLINMMTSGQFFGLEKIILMITSGQPVVGSKKNPRILFSIRRILFPNSLMNSPPPKNDKSPPLPSNTIANPKGELKAITTRSGIVLDGPSVPMPPSFINPDEDERVEETLTDLKLGEFTIKVLPPLVQKPKPPSQRNFVVHQRDPLHPNIPEDYLEDLFATNHLSGNPTFSSHTDLTSLEVKDDIFDPKGDIVLDSTKDLPPLQNINPLSGSTTSSSPDHLLEEFADELAFITFPPRNDGLPNLADPNVNLFDTIPEMFTDEHALDYSSPPRNDDYDDDLFEIEFDNEYVYDDPFDSKGEKIKESKLLIDELDFLRSSDFLPSPEYDSFLFEDFSKVDDLPSTNNEDKVFNPGILIQENLFEVTTHVVPDKNVRDSTLVLSENEEKVFKPRILTSKGVHSSLLPELSHRGNKAFKVIKIIEGPMEIFPCSYKEDIRILDVPCLHFYPP